MTYGNYAPFYRGGYFNPMQTPIMQAEPQNQFTQPYQPMQNSAQPVNEMLWVLNENEATSYPVAPNNSVVLWDKNTPTIYIKSVNAQGVPSMRILDFTERIENTPESIPKSHICRCGDKFVTADKFEELKGKFEALTLKIENLTEKPKTKTKKEIEEDA